MAHNSTSEKSVVSAWTPDLFGPIFKRDSLTLKQVLNLRNADEQTHLMAAFIPDEIIRRLDVTEKASWSFQAVLLVMNISGFSTLFKKYIYEENKSSPDLTTMLNNYVNVVVREVYYNGGDVLKFSAEGLLAAWKVRDGEFMFDVVRNVIARAVCIQSSVAALNNDGLPKASIAISAGDVTFSVIGGDETRNFVISGSPIGELKRARSVSLPNELVLSSSAWHHCTPSQYEYVIKDQYNIKIVKVLGRSDTITSPSANDARSTVRRRSVTFSIDSSLSRPSRTRVNEEAHADATIADRTKGRASTTISAISATNASLGTQLRSYLAKAVIQQIEQGRPVEFLAEIKRITMISLDIVPKKYLDNGLIPLVDKCFLLLHGIIVQYAGCINTVNLYDKNILFCIVFGIIDRKDEEKFKIDESCRNALTCAMQILQTIKSVGELQSLFVGVSTGMAYCGVIGHAARRYYAIIGPLVDRAMGIMDISYNKISCDYDTVLRSHLGMNQFRSRGIRTLRLLKKCHIYEYVGDTPETKDLDATLSLDYCYPILGRLQELDDFNDVLDEIGVANRDYSGLLIEGDERSGKSRLLDAFVTNVCNRRIKPIKLSLHVTYAEKAYTVVHHIILQMLEAEDCSTVEQRKRALLVKLGDILALEDFCYLNILMRVNFPLSATYCSDSDSQRCTKTIDIFGTILKQLGTKICILLDDIQYMDDVSWQFLSLALNNDNVVMAMTMLKPNSLDDSSHVNVEICRDERLMKRALLGLNPDLLPTFACQFLNVLAIPRKLSRTLKRRKDGHIGWCETFLTLILQTDALDFIRISPNEVRQHDIVFANESLVTKLPVELTPEELAPPLSWPRRTHLDVCVINARYAETDAITDRDMRELIIQIYSGMNPYEQSFITCAATLGTVFKCNVLQNVISTAILPHITEIVGKMIRIRMLECASFQRRHFQSAKDLAFCITKYRKTFSNMHHLILCHCRRSQNIIDTFLYAHCNMMEFKVDLFRKIIYDIQSEKEKQEYNRRAARILNQSARKCSSCGSGIFLRVPSKDVSTEMGNRVYSPRTSLIRRRTTITNRNDKSMIPRQSTLSVGRISLARKRESIARRIPIMPTYLDHEEDEGNGNIRKSLIGELSRFRKRSASTVPATTEDPSRGENFFEKLSHIDYRNCQCNVIVNCLFWRLHQHIENSGEINRMVDFLVEYSAGLMQTAQPSHAIKLLSIAAERNATAETSERTDDNAEDIIANKRIILILTGDACHALGNYARAKRHYTTAMALRGASSKINKAVCYDVIASRVYCKLRGLPHRRSKVPGPLAAKKLELASYTRRLCVTLMIEKRSKAARLFALRSVKLGLPSGGSFVEKGEIYLAAVRVFQSTRSIELIRCVERSMINVITTRIAQNDAEEMTMLANIYFTMYHVRALRGELEDAVNMGMKVLRIAEALHLDNLTLLTMPSLIQIMVWTKRINVAVDLMKLLYFAAEDDVDLSGKTWYYALSLEFILDAGIIVESYETSLNYYRECIAYRSKSCVSRDPQSLRCLLTCLWIYQLRMGHTITNTVIHIYSAKEYTKDVSHDDFSRIFFCGKGLECYLLMLLHCINTKRSNGLLNLVQDVDIIIKCLKNVSAHAIVIKPRLYLLTAYLNIIRGRKSVARFYLRRAQRFAALQGNNLIAAWIIQNRRTWINQIYNNMAQYWSEHIGSTDFVAWQYIRNFSVDVWSTILYPLPLPDSYL